MLGIQLRVPCQTFVYTGQAGEVNLRRRKALVVLYDIVIFKAIQDMLRKDRREMQEYTRDGSEAVLWLHKCMHATVIPAWRFQTHCSGITSTL